MHVEVRQNGKVFKQTYKRGTPVAPLKEVGVTDKRGTKTTFKPDPEIFETLEYSIDTLANRLRELAFLNSGIRITLTDERRSRPRSRSSITKAASSSSSSTSTSPSRSFTTR